jgi:hypothetical protein
MRKYLNLDPIKTSLCAVAVAVTLVFCVTVTFGQEPAVDIDAKKTEPASVEQVDKGKKTEALPSKFGDPENVVAKYKPIVEGSRVTNPVKPFTEEVNTAAPEPSKQTTGDSDWHIAFSPYLYLTGLQGQVGARNRTLDIDLSFGDVLKDFKFGLMGTTEFRRKKLIILNDIIWISLSQEHSDPPPSLFLETQIKVKTFIWGPEIGYRLVDSTRGTFDVRGGFRLMSIKNELTTTTGILQGFDVSGRKTWATPIAGVFGNYNVTEKFFLAGRFDIGGGWGADFTSQVFLGGGFKLKPCMSLIGGWRYLTTDYDDHTGFIFDATMKGFIIGMRFQLK